MRANLHIHSKFSDGTQWPEEIVAKGQRFGFEMVGLTDHDSMEGIASFLNACTTVGMRGIPGVEVDCQITNRVDLDYSSEVLGYFPEGDYSGMFSFLQERLDQRTKLMQSYIRSARTVFNQPDLNFKGFLANKLGFWNKMMEGLIFSSLKPDLLSYLQQKQVIPAEMTLEEFKSKFFSEGGTLNTDGEENTGTLGGSGGSRPSMKEVVDVILDSGGYPVLPHPGHWFWGDGNEKHDVGILLDYCKEIGIWGVELYYYPVDGDKINTIVGRQAKKRDLHLTFGTDCHGRGSHRDTLEQSLVRFSIP